MIRILREPCDDQRQRLTFSGTLTAPKSSGRSLLYKIADGFQFSWIYTYALRLPFNVLLGSDHNNDTNNNDHPIGVGRNTGHGFDYGSLDLRLSRRFAFTEKMGPEFLIEGFNVLNRSNLSVPNNTITSLSFGRATVACGRDRSRWE